MIASPTSSLPTSFTTIKKKTVVDEHWNIRSHLVLIFIMSGTIQYTQVFNSENIYISRKLSHYRERFLHYYHQTIISHYNMSSDLLEHAQ